MAWCILWPLNIYAFMQKLGLRTGMILGSFYLTWFIVKLRLRIVATNVNQNLIISVLFHIIWWSDLEQNQPETRPHLEQQLCNADPNKHVYLLWP